MKEKSGSKRIYFIDNARAVASLAGFIVHVGMIFSTPYIINIDASEYSHGLKFVLRDLNYYRMPLFLFAAGFFTIYGIRKYTTIKFILHRAQRILMPFVVSCLIILPFQAFFYTRFEYGGQWKDFFLKNANPVGSPFGLTHLWFLYHIFVYSIAMMIVFWFFKHYGLTFKKKLMVVLHKINRNIYSLMAFWIIFSLITYLAGYLPGNIDNALLSLFDLKRAGLEFPIFLFGCYTYINREVLVNHISGRIDKILIPFAFYIGILVISRLIKADPLVMQLTVILIRWGMFLAVINLIKLLLDFNNKVLGYMAKASYPIYLFHHPVIIALGYFYVKNPLFDSTIPGFFFLLIVSLIITYSLYELLINRNRIGSFLFTGTPLNEKHDKPKKKEKKSTVIVGETSPVT